jgi:hypothetical protein
MSAERKFLGAKIFEWQRRLPGLQVYALITILNSEVEIERTEFKSGD